MKEKKKFWLGMVAGIGLSLLVSLSAVLVVQIKYLDWQLDNELITGNNGGNQSGQQGKPNSNQSAKPESGKPGESVDSSNAGDESEDIEIIAGMQGEIDWKNVENKIEFLQQLIERYYMNDYNAEDMESGLYKGMVNSLGDPYTVYYSPEEYAEFMESSSGVYCGIGVQVSQNMGTGIITVTRTFTSGSSYEEGMLPGDILYKVEDEEVTGMDLSTVVSKIKGEEGTYVNVSVVRSGEPDYLNFHLERRQIEVDTIEYEMFADHIGYISIMEFDEVTAAQFRKAIDELEEQGMQGLVIDVRNNPGGLLDKVCDMLDRMLPEGLIVYTEDKYGERNEECSTDEEYFDKPLVVLVNHNSASASEIFAGAIQDYGIGTILGTQTYGKGIVQTLLPLNDGSAMKVTISKYFTPNGHYIHEVGITPDEVLELDPELAKMAIIPKDQDNQLQRALELIREELK